MACACVCRHVKKIPLEIYVMYLGNNYVTNRRDMGSIPDGVIGIFQ
jgi:hypothetical protein